MKMDKTQTPADIEKLNLEAEMFRELEVREMKYDVV